MTVTESAAEQEVNLDDENAFGLWVSWFDSEEVEYSESAERFPPRIVVFRSAVADYVAGFELGRDPIALDFGTSMYFELADTDTTEDLIQWMSSLRAWLAQGDWRTFAVITHGGRWVSSMSALPLAAMGNVRLLARLGPSEPMRRAFAAEACSHDDEDAEVEGWGPGLFVDVDALEAMHRKLKNQPTALRAGGTSFVRICS